jgi:AraC-like DNA-binding protein
MPATMDALSDVLRNVRLSGAVFFDVDATAPWVAEAPPAIELAHLVMPGAQHVIEYHAVVSGSCYGGLVDGEAVLLRAGDVIVFPHGDRHVLASAPGMRGSFDPALMERPPNTRLPIAYHEGPPGPKDAHVYCGFLGCDVRPFNPLIASLPRVLVASADQGPRGNWLEQFMRCAALEAQDARQGGECVLTRLSELMFIEVVRRHLDALPPEQTGFLSGLRDPQIGCALTRVHAAPAEPWSLESLAQLAGMSRSVFAERFAELLGMPPMQYVTQWRMQLAAGLLSRTGLPLAQIAAQVGYESEAAFSRAFKKAVGEAPGSFRKQHEVR